MVFAKKILCQIILNIIFKAFYCCCFYFFFFFCYSLLNLMIFFHHFYVHYDVLCGVRFCFGILCFIASCQTYWRVRLKALIFFTVLNSLKENFLLLSDYFGTAGVIYSSCSSFLFDLICYLKRLFFNNFN